ncbi:hypothetical protein BC936DRAFT_146082 [Jimgerdemannia flammicorona]|uniref:Transmembrane protein n=1 Tax=Jimgerdemannia flammicorona TaxID=994334 RepID=A0A433D8I7_9FUNG|nr:hypothetical protein BC936DRAFT_146082 [Jimgerdemannia flammicorona]
MSKSEGGSTPLSGRFMIDRREPQQPLTKVTPSPVLFGRKDTYGFLYKFVYYYHICWSNCILVFYLYVISCVRVFWSLFVLYLIPRHKKKKINKKKGWPTTQNSFALLTK